MHVDETGPAGAPPLLLLHGGGVSGWMWRPTLAALRAPVRAIVPDLPGHGASASDGDYRSHAETLEALERMLEDRAPSGAAVVGFSLGAQLAVLLTAKRPDLVADAVIVSAQARPLAMAGMTLALLAASAPLAKRPRFARLQAKQLCVPLPLMPAYLADSARISRATLVASVGDNLRFTVPDAWGRSSVDEPLIGDAGAAHPLVIVGARERRLMRDSARILHEARAGSELRMVDGVGHGLPLQRPGLLASILEQRLERGHPSG